MTTIMVRDLDPTTGKAGGWREVAEGRSVECTDETLLQLGLFDDDGSGFLSLPFWGLDPNGRVWPRASAAGGVVIDGDAIVFVHGPHPADR